MADFHIFEMCPGLAIPRSFAGLLGDFSGICQEKVVTTERDPRDLCDSLFFLVLEADLLSWLQTFNYYHLFGSSVNSEQ